jgi:predicted NBD/HSP70 family sugar kinase/DNA-binding XRE family transcriptional regulator
MKTIQPKNEARPSLLKQINSVRLLDLLRSNSGITRADLARHTGLMRSTVSEIIKELMNDGLILSEELTAHSRSGRKGEGLILNPEGAFFIGASIAGEHITVVKVNLAKERLVKRRHRIEKDKTPETVLNTLVELIKELCSADSLSNQKLRGIGVAVQGTLNLNGVAILCPFLKWENVDLRHYLEPALRDYINDQSKLIIDNDANAAALAEVYFNSTIQNNSLLYVLINQGMGAGIVIQNRLWRGFNGTAGEPGSLRLNPFSFSNALISQPKTLNDVVGGVGLLRRYRELGGKSENLDNLIETLPKDFRQNEPKAKKVVEEWTEYLGWGLIALVNILNPEFLVLGGPVSNLMLNLPNVKARLDEILRDHVSGNGENGFFLGGRDIAGSNTNRFYLSQYADVAAAMGGAMLAYHSLFEIPDLELLRYGRL